MAKEPSTIVSDEEHQDNRVKEPTIHQKIAGIQQHLTSVITALGDAKSILTRMAHFWGKRPLWQKIVAGLVLTIPLIISGILAQLVTLCVAGVVTALAYLGSSYLLDDHEKVGKSSKEKLEKGVSDLTGLFGESIVMLDTLCQQFTVEIEHLKQQNTLLTGNIESLSSEVRLHINQLSETTKVLGLTEGNLTRISLELTTTKEALSQKILELEEVKRSLGLEIDKLRGLLKVLQGTVQLFSDAVIVDEKNRGLFQERLEAFLSDSKASFDKVADRICAAEQELSIVKVALEKSNERYKELLDRHEAQLNNFLKKTQQPPEDDLSAPKHGGMFQDVKNRAVPESSFNAGSPSLAA